MAIKIFENIDCMEGMKKYRELLQSRKVLTICDPPYGIGFKYNNYEDTEENLKYLIENCFKPLIEISERSLFFVNHTKIHLWPRVDWIHSVKWNTTGSYGKLGICQWMPILFYGKDVKGFGSVNGQMKSDISEISGGDGVGFRRQENINHPCPKPKNLIGKLIKRFAEKNDLIVDFTVGSGTTLIMAEKMGFEYIGFELDPDYYRDAKARLERETAQVDLFKPEEMKSDRIQRELF